MTCRCRLISGRLFGNHVRPVLFAVATTVAIPFKHKADTEKREDTAHDRHLYQPERNNFVSTLLDAIIKIAHLILRSEYRIIRQLHCKEIYNISSHHAK